MSAALGPAHLLLLHKAFANHVVHGRFNKRRGNRLVVPVAVAIVRDERLIGPDIATELFQGAFDEREIKVREGFQAIR